MDVQALAILAVLVCFGVFVAAIHLAAAAAALDTGGHNRSTDSGPRG